MDWWNTSRTVRFLAAVFIVFGCVWIGIEVKKIIDEVNTPIGPDADRFFLTWRNTDNPPLIYEDVDSDDTDAIAGLKENTWKYIGNDIWDQLINVN